MRVATYCHSICDKVGLYIQNLNNCVVIGWLLSCIATYEAHRLNAIGKMETYLGHGGWTDLDGKAN